MRGSKLEYSTQLLLLLAYLTMFPFTPRYLGLMIFAKQLIKINLGQRFFFHAIVTKLSQFGLCFRISALYYWLLTSVGSTRLK